MKKSRKQRKGIAIAQLAGIAIAFVVVAIVISMGADILGEIQAEQTNDSLEENITGKGMEGLETLGNWLPTIALVIAAAVVIGIVVTYFGRTSGGA